MGVAERKEGRETKTKGRLGAVGGGIERFEAAKAGGRGNERLNEDEHGFFVADEKRAIEIVFPTFSSSGERGNMDTLADGSLAKPRLRPGEAGNGHERPYFSLGVIFNDQYVGGRNRRQQARDTSNESLGY